MQKNVNQSIFIQLSSIAAALLEEEYGSIKKETDDHILKNYNNINQILCFRIGYVIQSLLKGGIVKDVYDFSPEQLAKFPVQPIVVHELNENNIYPAHMKDIVLAVLNTADIFDSNDKTREN